VAIFVVFAPVKTMVDQEAFVLRWKAPAVVNAVLPQVAVWDNVSTLNSPRHLVARCSSALILATVWHGELVRVVGRR
jgi:hypothetical protein